MNAIKRFLKEEDGLGTVEIVLLIAVLIAVALIFGKTIKTWFVTNILSSVTRSGNEAVYQIQE